MSEAGTILMVEPEILVREKLAAYLRDCGYRVAEAVSAGEARILLESSQLEIDLVLADAGADADGVFGLAQWIRQTRPEVEVVLAGTAVKAAREAGDLCRESPAPTKPYNHQAVLDHIKRILSSRPRG